MKKKTRATKFAPVEKISAPPVTEPRGVLPSRRQFLQTTAGAGLALAGSSILAWADHHGHPSPNTISYLDRRMYVRNMEVLAFLPGENRHGKIQMMSVGNRRYMFQQGD